MRCSPYHMRCQSIIRVGRQINVEIRHSDGSYKPRSSTYCLFEEEQILRYFFSLRLHVSCFSFLLVGLRDGEELEDGINRSWNEGAVAVEYGCK